MCMGGGGSVSVSVWGEGGGGREAVLSYKDIAKVGGGASQ